jgi:hypothetical protein
MVAQEKPGKLKSTIPIITYRVRAVQAGLSKKLKIYLKY